MKNSFVLNLWKNNKEVRVVTLFAFLFCFLNLLINNINHRFNVSDFKVYYQAAQNLLGGGRVYFIAFGLDSGFFKYSPFNLLLFIPYGLMNFWVAAILHFCLLSIAFWYSYLIIGRLLNRYFFPGLVNVGGLLILGMLGSAIFMVKELYLGNINMILIVLCLMAIDQRIKGNIKWASVMLGVVCITKPFFLILILPLLFRKEMKMIMGSLLTIGAGIALPFLALGFNKGYALTHDWVDTVFKHSSDFPSKNSFEYLLRHHLFPSMPGYIDYVIILGAAILIIAMIGRNLYTEKKDSLPRSASEQHLLFEWFIIMALLPNIVRTDTEHFLASAPIITFIIFYGRSDKVKWLIPVMVVLLFFFGGNSQDLLGKSLSDTLFYMGLIGLSNLLMVLLAYLLYQTKSFKRRAVLGLDQ